MWPGSIADLLFANIAKGEEERGRVYEAVVGLVTNNRDPDGLGRVKLRFPTLSTGDDSAWAPIVSVGAGKGRGWFFVPEVDDEVLVLFEHGDIGRPLVIGAMWNGTDKPPRSNGDGKNPVRSIVSRGGSKITFDDDQGTVTFEDGGGAGSITIDKQNKITLEAKQGDVAIHCKDDLTIVANEVELVATATLDLVSSSGDIQGGADGKVKLAGQAMLKVDGASVAINGGSASAPAMPSANPQEVPMEVGSGGGGGGGGANAKGGSGNGTGTGTGNGSGSAQVATQDDHAGNPIPPDADAPPATPPDQPPPKDTVIVTVLDQAGAPIAGVAFELRASDGATTRGTTSPEGVIEVHGLPPGDCTLTLPDLDEKDWSIAPAKAT